jgi:hypothetical protein
MRVIFKTFFILSLLSVLYVLSPHPIYAAACSGSGYTCRLNDCAVGEEEDTSRTCSVYGYICCKKVPTSTPAPQPTNTPKPGASPTVTTAPSPTIGGVVCPNPTYPNCSGTDYCNVTNCGKTIAGCPNPPIPTVPNCSSSCRNGHCYTTQPGTNPTITDVACRSSNDYGSWSSCMSGQDTCGACAAQGYTCQVRYCINPPNSNQYQISCGCTQPTSPPGNNGSTPTPTAFLRLRLLNPGSFTVFPLSPLPYPL